MHEMSIAQGIMDIALDYAGRNGARSIHEIGLRIGEMAGVVLESLEFSFRMIAKGTPAENAIYAEKRPTLKTIIFFAPAARTES